MTAAVVLAAGPGTRLGPLSNRVPKPMMPVAGRPYLEHLASQLLDAGLRPIIVTVNHLAHVIRDHFAGQERWAEMKLITTRQGGTGADLLDCLNHLSDTFVVWNGDTIVDLDITALQASAAHDPTSGMIVLTRQLGVPNEAAFYVADDGVVLTSMEAVPTPEAPDVYAWRGASTGVAILRKSLVLPFTQSRPASFEQTILPALISARQIRAFDNGTRYFLDFGTPERLAQLWRDTTATRHLLQDPPQ